MRIFITESKVKQLEPERREALKGDITLITTSDIIEILSLFLVDENNKPIDRESAQCIIRGCSIRETLAAFRSALIMINRVN